MIIDRSTKDSDQPTIDVPIDPGIDQDQGDQERLLILNSFDRSSKTDNLRGEIDPQTLNGNINNNKNNNNQSPSTRPSHQFGDKNDAQIMKILENLSNSNSNDTTNDQSWELREEELHPVLRSQSQAQLSNQDSDQNQIPNFHLNPQLFLGVSSSSETAEAAAKTTTTTKTTSPSSRSIIPTDHLHQLSSIDSPIPTGYHPSSSINFTRNGSVSGNRKDQRKKSLGSIRFTNQSHASQPHQNQIFKNRQVAESGPSRSNPSHWIQRSSSKLSGENGQTDYDKNCDEIRQHRKNNHKEVERRRRETINEGITELKKIVPGTEKNKGEILRQAVKYIQSLQESEKTNGERYKFEKILNDQALNEMRTKYEKLERNYERLEKENKSLKRWIVELGEDEEIRRRVGGGESWSEKIAIMEVDRGCDDKVGDFGSTPLSNQEGLRRNDSRRGEGGSSTSRLGDRFNANRFVSSSSDSLDKPQRKSVHKEDQDGSNTKDFQEEEEVEEEEEELEEGQRNSRTFMKRRQRSRRDDGIDLSHQEEEEEVEEGYWEISERRERDILVDENCNSNSSSSNDDDDDEDGIGDEKSKKIRLN